MLEIGKGSGNISWVTKSKCNGKSGRDILVSVHRSNNKAQGNITFRNKQFDKFKSGYVMFGLSGTRLYIVEADSKDGYKLCDSVSYNKNCKVANETFADWCKNHRGEYALEYDSDLSMYYVETADKEI